MTSKTLSVAGYCSSGSSAFIDILREFDNTVIMDEAEFCLLWIIDGIGDLDYFINGYSSTAASTVAINRFREYMNKKLPAISKEDREIYDKLTEEYIEKITMCSYRGRVAGLGTFKQKTRIKKMQEIFLRKLRLPVQENIPPLCDMKLSINPTNFDEATKDFVAKILNAIYRKNNEERANKISVVDQLFAARNPVRYFKYVENPYALVVDRDPRDHYLFGKTFLRKRGRFFYPTDNVNDYIKYFRTTRQISSESKENKNVAFFNFEELIYDCDNTAKKLADFLGLEKRIHKGIFFKPAQSRNNSQLFKKYPEFSSDIKKIEKELQDFLFPFENYKDIEPEGTMFWGSQNRKGI